MHNCNSELQCSEWQRWPKDSGCNVVEEYNDGSVTKLLAKPVLGHPNWSSDGQYLLFTTDRSEIAMFDHSKGVILEVPVGLGFDPIWSPT